VVKWEAEGSKSSP